MCPARIELAYPAWKAGASATRPRAHRRRKERESNPQGSSLACFRDRCHRPLACPSVEAAAAGIEPAKGRLTGACLYQHRPHRNKSGWQDLNLRSQAPRACAMPGFATLWQSRCGQIRTADLVLPKHAGFQTTPHTDFNFKAPSGSRTRTSAMARQQATATSWKAFVWQK